MGNYYNPYEGTKNADGKWMKCNFHIHAEVGNLPTETIFEYYKEAEYDILMHSSQRKFEDTRKIGEKLGITTYNGQEYIRYDGILLVGIHELIMGEPQEAIDKCIEEGGFAIINHPNQAEAKVEIEVEGGFSLPPVFPKDILYSLRRAVGVEIYNGCLSRRNFFGGQPLGWGIGTDFWDDQLSKGILFWGFANDDSHQPFEINVGWTHIFAGSASLEEVKKAVKKGNLYASNGLYLHEYSFDGKTIRVTADFRYDRIKKIHYKFIGQNGVVLAEQDGESGSYTLKGDEMYVRVEAMAPDGDMLWTQPLVDKDRFKDENGIF